MMNWTKAAVHGDMFPDNVFFKEGKVSGLIDFYFASYDFLIYSPSYCD